MSMQAQVLRNSLGDIIVHMSGDLEYDHSIPLRNQINGLVSENPNATITIDIGAVDFVGSSGICHFVETLTLINKEYNFKKVSLSNISDDFKKILRLYSKDDVESILDDFEMNNDDTESLNTLFGNRRRTFEN